MRVIIAMAIFFCFFHISLNAGEIKTRALHLVIRGSEDMGKMKELVLFAKKNHFNTLILMIDGGVELDSLRGMYNKNAWSKKEFALFINFVNNQSLEVIPEVKFLTHQQLFFKNVYPTLMLNERTYNPNNPKVYEKVYPIIDEVIELTGCKIFHIGHDEVVGYGRFNNHNWIKYGEKRLLLEDYYADILKLHGYLKQKKIRTMMWGDMLIAPDEFPEMNQGFMHGVEGFKSLRKKLPKDIIIGDWHYFGNETRFPSYKTFHEEGFTVWGATWSGEQTAKNFSQYVQNLNYPDSGMIATTWYGPTTKKADLVKEIIRFSGEAFDK